MDSLYSAERDLDRLEAKTVQTFDRNSAYRVCMDLVALSRSYRNRTEAVARHSPATPRDHHFVVRPVGSCCIGFVGSCCVGFVGSCIGSTHPCCIGSVHPPLLHRISPPLPHPVNPPLPHPINPHPHSTSAWTPLPHPPPSPFPTSRATSSRWK